MSQVTQSSLGMYCGQQGLHVILPHLVAGYSPVVQDVSVDTQQQSVQFSGKTYMSYPSLDRLVNW